MRATYAHVCGHTFQKGSVPLEWLALTIKKGYFSHHKLARVRARSNSRDVNTSSAAAKRHYNVLCSVPFHGHPWGGSVATAHDVSISLESTGRRNVIRHKTALQQTCSRLFTSLSDCMQCLLFLEFDFLTQAYTLQIAHLRSDQRRMHSR